MSINSYDLVGEALYAADRGQWSRTFRLIRDLDDPLASKFFHWLTLTEDKGKAEFDELALFILENPMWPGIEELQERAEGVLPILLIGTLTLELFEDREPLTTRGRVRLAEALSLLASMKWQRCRSSMRGSEGSLPQRKRRVSLSGISVILQTMITMSA